MTALDKEFRKLATDLIAKYGKTVTLTSTAVGTYEPLVGQTVNASAPVSVSVKAIIKDYKREFSSEKGLILVGDKKFTIAAAGITKPKPGDTITLDGAVWRVVDVKETWSGEQIASYSVQARI